MLNKEILKIIFQLEKDCPDFSTLHPNTQNQIAHWINEDRFHTINNLKKRIKKRISYKQMPFGLAHLTQEINKRKKVL